MPAGRLANCAWTVAEFGAPAVAGFSVTNAGPAPVGVNVACHGGTVPLGCVSVSVCGGGATPSTPFTFSAPLGAMSSPGVTVYVYVSVCRPLATGPVVQVWSAQPMKVMPLVAVPGFTKLYGTSVGRTGNVHDEVPLHVRPVARPFSKRIYVVPEPNVVIVTVCAAGPSGSS